MQNEPRDGLVWIELGCPLWRNVARESRVDRHWQTLISQLIAALRRKRESGAWNDVVPSRLIKGSVEHREHAVVLAEYLADRSSREDFERLQFTQQQQPERLVHIGAGKQNPANWRVPYATTWIKEGIGFDLGSQIR